MNAPTGKIQASARVYEKIAAVQGELAHTGIGKDSENSFDRYKFRGIDAVYNALAPLLAKHGLCVLPRIIERDCQERTSRKGEPMFYVTVTAEFDFVAAEDGSAHTVRTYGEAMDRSDKATNKAMSAAYKYAAFMAFAIPTEGDNDADATTPEVASAVGSGTGQNGGRAASHTGPDSDRQVRPKGDGPTKSKLDAAEKEIVAEINSCADEGMLVAYLETAEYKAAKALLDEYRPSALYGPPPEGCPEYEPIKPMVTRLVREFREEAAAPNILAAG